MSGPRVVTVGELTVDDVIVEDECADWKQPGGGALYSAIGAKLWHGRAAICATVGPDYPDGLLETLTTAGIDTSAVRRTMECNSLGLWLLYERSGARHQFEKSTGGTFRQLDALRPRKDELGFNPAGVHLAPQSSEGHQLAIDDFGPIEATISLDLLVEDFIDVRPYLNGSVLHAVDAFLPSRAEVQALWGHDDTRRLKATLSALGFTGVLVVKRGPDGVEVATDSDVVRVPTAQANVVDVTGAGDAFCGGFLAGLINTGDPVLAAAHGVVSSSFIVETRGALAALDALNEDLAARRLKLVLQAIRTSA
jgi:sugar/nucleoside kinase (ribokinase family)